MKIQTKITEKLTSEFTPEFLEVVNESYQHNVPAGSESHFKVVLVTDTFIGKRLIQRHRAVNQCLADELANDIHALALHTYSPEEWQQQALAPTSPKCQGGGEGDETLEPKLPK